jgi:hypothetical protein
MLLNESSSGTISHGTCKDWNIPLGYYHNLKEKVWTWGMFTNAHLATVSIDLWGLGNCAASINILPDVVLLDIFDFCRINKLPVQLWICTWKWDVLVHVCRRWRRLIFASLHRLHIKLSCTPGTPVRTHLNSWPAFPIIVDYGDDSELTPSDEDNVIAALAHSNRIYALELAATKTQLEKLVRVMQEPYPILKRLVLTSDSNMPDLPDRFLSGSVLSLHALELESISFPLLPALLSSATDLVILYLYDIPNSAHIAPMALVAALIGLTRLWYLHIRLNSEELHPYWPDQESPHPATWATLPALQFLLVCGGFEYLEDFMAQIDTPQLNALALFFHWHQEVIYEVPQLSAFINRSDNLKKVLPSQCLFMVDKDDNVHLLIGKTASGQTDLWDPESEPGIFIGIECEGIEAQISHVAHVLSWIFPVLPDIVHFNMDSVLFMSERVYLDSVEWLQLLHQFSSI